MRGTLSSTPAVLAIWCGEAGGSCSVEAEFAVPGALGLHDRPVLLGNLVRAERCARPDLPGDGDAGDAYAVARQAGAEHGRRRPQGGLAERDGAPRRARVVGPAAAGEQDGP